jgi:hypothetical protein
MALALLALISIAVAVVDGVCVPKLASSYSSCTNLNENDFFKKYLDKGLIYGGNVAYPYETVFHATFNEAFLNCFGDGKCFFGDYNCATGEFLKYNYISYIPSENNANQLITSNGHISILYDETFNEYVNS